MKRKLSAFSNTFLFTIGVSILSFGLTGCEQSEDVLTGNLCNQEDHVHAVDLGLSVKWACCNVGANSPEEYGGYYAWGETEEKDFYEWSTYKWMDYEEKELTKYCETIDNKKSIDPEDDVARVLWGEDWRMPTQSEIQELIDHCTWTWTSLNGVYGYKVSGNGNSIFLPAAGSRYEDKITNQGLRGCYMSATLYEPDIEIEYCIGFNKKAYYHINDYRRNGHTVRPVRE